MVDFRRTSWEDANPGFVGAARVGDIFNRILENQKLGIANRYMPGTLQAEMAKKQAEAQYYGPKAESEMAEIYQGRIPHYQAQQRLIDMGQIPEYQAQARYHGAQATEQEQENRINKARTDNLLKLVELRRRAAAANGTNQTLGDQVQNMPGQQPPMGRPNMGANTLSGALGISRPGQPSPFEMQQPQQQVSQAPQMQQLQQQPPQMQQAAGPTLEEDINTILSGASKKGKGAAETPEEKQSRAIATHKENAIMDSNVKLGEKRAEAARTSNVAAEAMIKSLDRAEKASNELEVAEQGYLGGYSPGVSDARQVLKQSLAELKAAQLLVQKGLGPGTIARLKLIEDMKPSEFMNRDVRRQVIASIKSAALRVTEASSFDALAAESGFDPKQTEVLREKYDKERPEYDVKTGTIFTENLNSYADYMNREAYDAAIHGKPYSPRYSKGKAGHIKVRMPNGNVGYIPESSLEGSGATRI